MSKATREQASNASNDRPGTHLMDHVRFCECGYAGLDPRCKPVAPKPESAARCDVCGLPPGTAYFDNGVINDCEVCIQPVRPVAREKAADNG